MTQEFKLKVDLVRNIPFLLDAMLEIGVGLVVVIRANAPVGLLIFGWTFIAIGVMQFIRKMKTFYLTNSELIIRRPLFPFPFSEHLFLISKIREIRFINVNGRFGGSHLNIVTPDIAKSYRIQTTKEKIDEFEARLKSQGLTPIRERM